MICMHNAHKTKSDQTMQSTDCGRQGDFSITNDNDSIGIDQNERELNDKPSQVGREKSARAFD